MLRKLPALATAALVAVGIAAAPAATAAPAKPAQAAKVHTYTAKAIPSRSGLPWASGVFIPGDSAAAVASFGAWRGAGADVAITWTARSSWDDVVNATWLYDRWKTSPQTLVLGVPPVPEHAGANLAECAKGSYDAQWRTFGNNIKAAGISDRTIVRLGWELNGDWFAWSARNPAQFAACWRKVVTAADSAAPGLRWDWNVNRGPSQIGIDARKAYPGDAYVDYVGVDSYDGFPAVKSAAAWNTQLNGAFGLTFWANFARAHGKKLSVPEWGVYPGTAWAGHNGGDNPYYIAKMFEFFRAHAGELAYESYFNEPASYYAGALGMNPKAAAEYRRQINLTMGGLGRITT
jgi:glycosyl hydrolase family 26